MRDYEPNDEYWEIRTTLMCDALLNLCEPVLLKAAKVSFRHIKINFADYGFNQMKSMKFILIVFSCIIHGH